MPDWAAVYQEHGPSVLGYLLRRLDRREDAEDLAQETFARALRVGTGPRDESRTRAYLLSTAHNLLVNHRRRRRDLVRHESELDVDLPLEEVAHAARDHPEGRVRHRELVERVEAILRDLPGDQRRAFRLGVLEQRPYREVCLMTGWSLSKVKITVFRARKALVSRLQLHAPEDGPREGGLP